MNTRKIIIIAALFSILFASVSTIIFINSGKNSKKTNVTTTNSNSTHGKETAGNKIQWVDWSDDLFERAKRENRFVVLDLEAVWCHWCHVMDDITYRDPKVIELMNSKFIAVKVDQDSRPDLSNRYEDYGWPATIFFNSDGSEIAKRSGYMPPKEMESLLEAIIADPTPGPSVKAEKPLDYATTASITEDLKKEMEKSFVDSYDFKLGGWGFIHKFLDWDCVEYAMLRAKAGDQQAEKMAKQTLEAQLNLLDPVWGGIYQYSVETWQEAHFEKIMQMQAENMRIYSQAYSLWRDPSYLKAATEIHRYLKTFLTSPDGAFYTSQDADVIQGEHSEGYFKLSDAERRKQGIPRVDTHIYSRENGWMINALTYLYSATGEKKYLEDAVRAAQWIMKNRSIPGGGFRHDEKDPAGPYFGDNVAMGRALLSLYAVTGDRAWLKSAEEVAAFISNNFKNGEVPGFVTAKIPQGVKSGPTLPKPQRDENILMTRFVNLLYHYTGNEKYKSLAEQAMKYLATSDVATRRPTAGVLIAAQEIEKAPIHITVVGAKDDLQAETLFKAALSFPSGYRRVEWWDKREGKLPNQDVEYPELATAAAFACGESRCSAPAFKPEDVKVRVERLNATLN
ncbi:MAG: thioredoxin domain-containing protein [Blastocatellia bacterium]|nr:thioredoxin domain-containing protein [Blastocatellia bacterium]